MYAYGWLYLQGMWSSCKIAYIMAVNCYDHQSVNNYRPWREINLITEKLVTIEWYMGTILPFHTCVQFNICWGSKEQHAKVYMVYILCWMRVCMCHVICQSVRHDSKCFYLWIFHKIKAISKRYITTLQYAMPPANQHICVSREGNLHVGLKSFTCHKNLDVIESTLQLDF